MKKLAMLSLACMLAFPMTVHAEDADRIAALEEKVAALEQRVAALEGTTPAGVSEAPAQESFELTGTVETGMQYDGFSMEYVDFEITTDQSDVPCVILYFDYFNGSGETKHFSNSFDVTAFQHGKEMEPAYPSSNQAWQDTTTDLRSGADPLRVGVSFAITDQTEIIVSIEGFAGRGDGPVEFTLALE